MFIFFLKFLGCLWCFLLLIHKGTTPTVHATNNVVAMKNHIVNISFLCAATKVKAFSFNENLFFIVIMATVTSVCKGWLGILAYSKR